jgi:hypothetical protein
MDRRDVGPLLLGMLALAGCSSVAASGPTVATITTDITTATEIWEIVEGIANVAIDVATGNDLGAIVAGVATGKAIYTDLTTTGARLTYTTALTTDPVSALLSKSLSVLVLSAPYIIAKVR